MREQIFDPLGMRDTGADSATKPTPDRATSYFPRFAADPTYGLHLMRDVDYSCYAGSSAFLSTPSDLVRFGMAINSGRPPARRRVTVWAGIWRTLTWREHPCARWGTTESRSAG